MTVANMRTSLSCGRYNVYLERCSWNTGRQVVRRIHPMCFSGRKTSGTFNVKLVFSYNKRIYGVNKNSHFFFFQGLKSGDFKINMSLFLHKHPHEIHVESQQDIKDILWFIAIESLNKWANFFTSSLCGAVLLRTSSFNHVLYMPCVSKRRKKAYIKHSLYERMQLIAVFLL